jgi:hypothetical protein
MPIMVLLGGGISRFHNWASGNGLFVGRNGPPTRFVALVRSGPFKSTLTEILMPYWGNIYTADTSQFMHARWLKAPPARRADAYLKFGCYFTNTDGISQLF